MLPEYLWGEPICINWRSEDADWHWYILLRQDGDWLYLQGLDSPDGDPYTGPDFWANEADVETFSRLESTPEESR